MLNALKEVRKRRREGERERGKEGERERGREGERETETSQPDWFSKINLNAVELKKDRNKTAALKSTASPMN